LASIEAPQANQRSGEISTLKVLEQCARHGVKRLIFAGSASAYGDDPTPLKSESLAPKPLSPYAASKLAGEHYVRAFAKSFGLDGVSLRFFNVFGSHQRPNDSYAGVIPKFVASMREGVNPTIFGDGEQTRDFVHVANVVQASLLALRAQQRLNGDVFNVGSGIATSVNKLVSTLNQLGGTSFVPDYKPRRTGDPRQSCADLSLINASLGYTPAVGLSAGLQEVLASL
jgi:UDP-glucose 4-epimerase